MTASSSSDSDSSSSGSTSPEPDNKQKQTMKAVSKTKAEESSDGSSDSESSSGSESDSESSDEMDTTENAPKEPAQAKRVSTIGPQPYRPPMGFKSGNKQSPPSTSTTSLLSDLRGKQVIHITAPSYLPLSKIKEMSMSKVMKGEPILSYEGKTYGIPAEAFDQNDKEDKTLLTYHETTQTYRKAVDHIVSYNIQEVVNVPRPDQAAVEALRNTVKPPRPQPKNLKMRFRPVGSLPAPPETLGSDSDSDGEPLSKVPSAEREERKRKHHHTEADAAQTVSPRKKSKKHSQEIGAEDDGHKKSKKSHKDREEKKRKKSEKA